MESPLTIAEVAQKLGYKNPQTVRKLIEKGKLKSYGDGRMVRISPAALQEYISGNPEHESEDGEISESAKSDIQKMVDAAALAKAEVAKINAEIARDEATNRRDLPEALKKRHFELEGIKQALNDREKTIREKEEAQANRDIILDDKQNKTTQIALESKEYYDKRKKEADEYLAQCKLDTDGKVAQALSMAKEEADKIIKEAEESAAAIKFEMDTINVDFENKKSELANLDVKVAEAKKQMDLIGNQVKNYLPQVQNHAVQHYNQARQSSGSISAYHDTQANRGWDLEREIKKLLKQLGF